MATSERPRARFWDYTAGVPRVKPYAALNPSERAERRRQARHMLAAGVPGAAVARLLGVTKQAVSLWRRAMQTRRDVVSTGYRPGRRRALSRSQVRQLRKLIAHPPAYYGLTSRDGSWTWAAMTRLVGKRFGVQCVWQTVMRAVKV